MLATGLFILRISKQLRFRAAVRGLTSRIELREHQSRGGVRLDAT
jgi:hypothetical protein